MRRLEVLQYGPHAAIVECPNGLALQVAQALIETGRFMEVVPAERSVLVQLPSGMTRAEMQGIVDSLPEGLPQVVGRELVVPVVYDGEDLELVAAVTGLTVEQVIALHSGVTYLAAFAGFAPGYVYCTGLDPRLQLPRRPSPRTAVPAGSVAIADAYSAIYPTASPGGWHLLGHTDLTLFDMKRPEAALIRPGDRVRYTVRTS
ncbi:MAG: 5-oxoprolinase subunit B family protein [Candidatus Nanopelagicales bacterium]